MADLIQSATWPGVVAVESCEYVCSHGITPGRAVLTTYPQTAAPKEFGDLTFTDGVRTAVIRDCKVETVSASLTSEGQSYTLEIVDRRWRWAFGAISGNYNQKDSNGKLVPWTIRSPNELAVLLLKAMGERNPLITLPPGLARAAGANLDRYLRLGQNFPQTLTNPEQVWDHTVPAQALARLCELWGCRVVYQPILNRILITTLGRGKSFPNAPSEVIGPNIGQVAAPAYVGAFSTEPVKIQARFLLEAVGREWDNTYVPINELSYAPISNTKVKQISEVYEAIDGSGRALGMRLTWLDPLTRNEVSAYEYASQGLPTTADKFDHLIGRFNNNPAVAQYFTLERTSATVLKITAKGQMGRFQINVAQNPDASEQWCATRLIQAGGDVRNTWANCPPPFRNVQATDRLSVQEAQGLAQESVFRCYRILNRDPHDKFEVVGPGRPMTLPFVGKIKRRQQIYLLDTKVDQVVPSPRIPGAVNQGNRAPGGLESWCHPRWRRVARVLQRRQQIAGRNRHGFGVEELVRLVGDVLGRSGQAGTQHAPRRPGVRSVRHQRRRAAHHVRLPGVAIHAGGRLGRLPRNPQPHPRNGLLRSRRGNGPVHQVGGVASDPQRHGTDRMDRARGHEGGHRPAVRRRTPRHQDRVRRRTGCRTTGRVLPARGGHQVPDQGRRNPPVRRYLRTRPGRVLSAGELEDRERGDDDTFGQHRVPPEHRELPGATAGGEPAAG